jgi:magnesium chelatase family protein
MLIKCYGYAVHGIHASKVTIEVDMGTGINFHMVGLPDNAVKESQHRISAALRQIKYRMPGKQITINLAPADLRKEGAAYDLAIAAGILASNEDIAGHRCADYVMMGELSLDGEIRPIRGALPITVSARQDGFKGIILPKENALEAGVVQGIEVLAAASLEEVIGFLNASKGLEQVCIDPRVDFEKVVSAVEHDFSEVRGQENIKRSLEVAAAGGHNVILIGPPGAGKTMLSKRLPGILPPLSLEEALETTTIHSVAGRTNRRGGGLLTKRPFRSPHHTISEHVQLRRTQLDTYPTSSFQAS